MSRKLVCDCGHKKFSVLAHVAEEWIVDQYGEYLETGTDRETTHRPSVGRRRRSPPITKALCPLPRSGQRRTLEVLAAGRGSDEALADGGVNLLVRQLLH
jgi:hypothetical protein